MILISETFDLEGNPKLRVRLDKKSREFIYEVYINESHIKGYIQFNQYIYNMELRKLTKQFEMDLEKDYHNYNEPVLSD